MVELSKAMNKVYRSMVCGFFPVCLLISLSSASAQDAENILYWNENHRLGFADFRGTAQKEDTALSVSTKDVTHLLGGVSKSIVVLLTRNRYNTAFTIYAGMNKDSSWIRHPGDTITLKHEQGHFDLCEWYARILRRDI
jgi:hypothetical protein